MKSHNIIIIEDDDAIKIRENTGASPPWLELIVDDGKMYCSQTTLYFKSPEKAMDVARTIEMQARLMMEDALMAILNQVREAMMDEVGESVEADAPRDNETNEEIIT